MSAFSATASDISAPGDTAPNECADGDALPLHAAADVLGITEADVAGLADSGLLKTFVTGGPTLRQEAEHLAERMWQAALPTASTAPGVRLRDAVEAAGDGPRTWPVVIAALLDGRINAFRRRGVFGDTVAALVVPSERVVRELATSSDAEAPFIWTPTPDQTETRGQPNRKRPR